MSEYNFATRLQDLKDSYKAVESIGGYNPSNSLITVNALNDKITQIETANKDVSDIEKAIKLIQDERYNKVRGMKKDIGTAGLIERTRQIVNYVEGLGKDYSTQVEILKRLLNKMDPDDTRREPVNESDKTRSTSEQSFVSITSFAKEVLGVIQAIPVYDPANADITVTGYSQLIDEISALNTEIKKKQNTEYEGLIKKRRDLYDSKTDGINTIILQLKDYVLGNWGKDSDEYSKVRDIKIKD